MSQRKNRPASEGDYDFELLRAIEEVKKNKAKLVGLQFPEGLKTHAVDVARQIEKETGAKTVTFIGPVYGACDTKEREAEMLGVDLVIHFGHTAMMPKLGK
jgi:2-(3-amino-3-carboxypropyl)histidine synthase